jgi:hypothetical protein
MKEKDIVTEIHTNSAGQVICTDKKCKKKVFVQSTLLLFPLEKTL